MSRTIESMEGARAERRSQAGPMLMTWEDAKKAWAEKGYEAIKGSEATEADKADTGKVIIRWA